MVNVAIIEDNETIREGLAALINGTTDYKCIGAFPECESFLEKLPQLEVDVALMDIQLPGINGIEGVKEAKKIDPEINILMLTIYEESNVVFEALCAGACGYLVKKTPPTRLLDAIREVHEGGSPMSSHIARTVINVFQEMKTPKKDDTEYMLSERETQVLFFLGEGNNYQEIQ